MAIGAIDEAIRNVVAVGADPGRVAILDNFCWPSVGDEVTMGTLVRACEACYDAAKAYGIPFVSGKDSLHNQFTNQETGEVIRIPNTLLISAMGVIEDVRKCVTMDLKEVGSRVCLVSAKDVYDLKVLAATHRKMAEAIGEGLVLSCHDVSDGGIAVAAAEMCIASGLGIDVKEMEGAFEETAGRYLVEVKSVDELKRIVGDVAEVRELGVVQGVKKMGEVGIEEMTKAWRGTLDW
jgi:phosphoribosylformylglycinamidine synthase